MKAAQFSGPGDIRIDEMPAPQLAPGQVEVAVDWCGICGTDLHECTGGKIINAASIAAHPGFDNLGHYSVTKFAVRGLPQAAAKELAKQKITVNAYCPGIVVTDVWDLIDEKLGAYLGTAQGEALANYSQLVVLGRVQTPDDVAGFVSYLAGPDSDYMTGQPVMIDGGIVMS
jgi:meso-butanediol dehydrogenase / (S,S)-butanediol dehydrogenase / diacetyl reductase